MVRIAAQRTCIALALCWAQVAHANLGGSIDSIAADRSALQGSLAITRHLVYEVREISTESGMRVREFVNGAGTVFAVSWSGPAVPNLASLLGPHYPSLAHALSQLNRPGTHRALLIESPELVVVMSGHMRSYAGLALLPLFKPAAVSLVELR